jgi:hypothetical protein
MVPRADVERIQRLCAGRVPAEHSDEVRVECEVDPRAVTVVEWRPPWREHFGPEWTRMPIARFRYVATTRLWTLYYHRHTSRWERYPLLGSTTRIEPLLNELELDPICVFWG